MANMLLNLQTQFQKHWQKLSAQQKIVVTVCVALFLSGIVAFSFYMGRPDYSPLFTNLSPDDAGAIVTKLKENKILFQLNDGGRTIKVPAKDVYETRLSLASQGLPQGGNVGFEIFDKTNFFGMTEFNQRLNYQRALQGELERTIRQISSIDQARVHLVMPEKELYSEKEKEPTASIILKLKPGARLEKGQIKAILNLVKTGVEGLKENNVSIIDTNGVLLSRAYAEDSTFAPDMVASQFELKKMVERNIEEQIATMLSPILGPGKAVVRATVELDLVKKESTEENYTPIQGMKEGGIKRSEQKENEYFKGTGSTAGVGVPGATTNIGNVPGYQQTQSSGGSSDYTKDKSVTNYEVNKKVAHLVSSPGDIRKLSVSVLLDGTFPAETVNTIKQAVSSGVGINVARGDQIVVESMAFDKTYLEQEKKEMESLNRKDIISASLRVASIIVVTVIVLLFVLSMLRHAQVMKKATAEIKRVQETAATGPAGATLKDVVTPSGMGSGEPELNKQVLLLAKERPQEFAEAIKNWMSST